MRLDGRRESTNVDDRRGSSGGGFRLGGKGGLGIGAAIVIALITMFLGGDPSSVFSMLDGEDEYTGVVTSSSGSKVESRSQQEQELEHFAKQVLASTEDVWTEEFRKIGRTYEPPTLVLFSGSVQSGCGGATSSSGPFYCSADESVYIDLSFFMNMKSSLGADGDFAYAYVIAHEVGHHVQHLLGTLNDAHARMSHLSEEEANKVSVRLELQADCYAGIWAYHENKMFSSLEDGDLEEAITTASVIGDDYLQKKAQGYTVPESFNHGTSKQRMKWLKKGFESGDLNIADTFSPSYSNL